MEKIKIAGRLVGAGEPCFIIAEAGSNHNRKLAQAKQLIDVAAGSDADEVKFPIFSAETLISEKMPEFDLLKSIELPREWVGELAEYARGKGIIFLATPFDEEAVDQLHETGAPAYKWSSQEIVNLPLLAYAASQGKPMILATGTCNLADIQEGVNTVYATGNKDIILLQCTSLVHYPVKPHQVNLRMMDTLRDAFHLPVGLSDHTLSITIPAAAVARGACIIEKHFTLSRKLKGPDHSFALEPEELKQMITAIREVEESLGSPVKRMIADEEEVARRRPSLIARVNIARGTRLTRDMIIIKRPGYGIQPRFLDIAIGREAKRDIEKGEGITWDIIL